MKQEDKDLLLKDLCARLPYGVKINVKEEIYDNRSCHLTDIHHGLDTYVAVPDGMQYHIENIKPYLFPLSSMTEEQYNELGEYLRMDIDSVIEYNKKDIKCAIPYFNVLDWYNKNHFDYRGLIEKGLAIDATGKNIY